LVVAKTLILTSPRRAQGRQTMWRANKYRVTLTLTMLYL